MAGQFQGRERWLIQQPRVIRLLLAGIVVLLTAFALLVATLYTTQDADLAARTLRHLRAEQSGGSSAYGHDGGAHWQQVPRAALGHDGCARTLRVPKVACLCTPDAAAPPAH